MSQARWFVFILVLALAAGHSRAQNPVQWSGSVSQSVARAREQSLPLLFWVTDGRGRGDDDDLEDAQEDSFRDPVVVRTIHSHFVPVRVSRTSRVMDEAQKLGLPSTHGLYCAVVTPDGRLLGQMGPGEVANPAAFGAALNAAFSRHCEELYEKEIRPLLENLSTPKPQARLAAQTVYRLNLRTADKAIIGLLARPDLLPGERSRIYELLAALGTEASITALLEKSDDKAAVAALRRADLGAVQWMIAGLPTAEGEISARQMAAYQGTMQVCRLGSPKAKEWWERAKPEDRTKELDRVRSKAEGMAEYWRQTEGAP